MQNLQIIELRGMRVLTSAQIADCYGTTLDCIKQNFHANKARYVEGKHYIAVAGDELKAFKDKVRNSHLANIDMENEVRIPNQASNKARYQFDTKFKYAKLLYLWTEKGALLHAKSLNTDKAWEVYDYLVDFYFRAKEKAPEPEPVKKKVLHEPAEITKIPEEKKSGFDIAPPFREMLTLLPIEALDEMEKCFRGGANRAVKLAGVAILAEKMKRQMN